MAYRFGAEEDVRDAIVRCAREQLDHAVSELSERIGEDPVAAVHEARKAVKKQRSLLRLARGAMAPRERRRENRASREAARGLSDARDAEVMVQTIGQLAERYAGQLPESTFAAVSGRLQAARDRQRTRTAGSALDDRAVRELGAARLRVDDWALRSGGWDAIEPGLIRSYRQGRTAWRRAQHEPSLEDLHAWRKRVKDLWYQQRLLAPVCGPAAAGQAKDAHRLADLLGDDHDLGVLRQTLIGEHLDVAVDGIAVVRLIDHRRAELQTEAIRLGGRVYAETPKAFRQRMRRCWKAGRAEQGGEGAVRRDKPPPPSSSLRSTRT